VLTRFLYSDSIADFLRKADEEILGELVLNYSFNLEQSQKHAWLEQIRILRPILSDYQGTIYFEYSIPRMGKRIDVVLLISSVIFVLEFKTGESEFSAFANDQVWDYALDLSNFHEGSAEQLIAPFLIASNAATGIITVASTPQNNHILFPIDCSIESLPAAIKSVLEFTDGDDIERVKWESGRYRPTPTIIEAATALYRGHSVSEISRNDATEINLHVTSETIAKIIEETRAKNQKAICFVTGVPGAGKTLVGLNIATKFVDKTSELYSVFLSGNDPLVNILREALARDKVAMEKKKGNRVKKTTALSEVKVFIQNVHHFRDECLVDASNPPIEHVALFDEAQRAWNKQQTAAFMKRRKNVADFDISEPEFLISCLDRHQDWAVIVCLVGGGQEINIGEAGITEWIEALNREYPHWITYISSRLHDSEYNAAEVLRSLDSREDVNYLDDLHLAVSMRSFRAENVSLLVKQLLDLDTEGARHTLKEINSKFPIVITRDLSKAKAWLRAKASGSERFGIVVSSQAERLKPHAIDVKSPMNPVNWFLDGKEDVRSSYYLEAVATEFQVQGLELDWACVTWDADFRYSKSGWLHRSFVGSKWNKIHKPENQNYQKNAYRVLLTRARQGMVIVVPRGEKSDPTRDSSYYDPTFEYLQSIGFAVI
jgi:hypothetical protein